MRHIGDIRQIVNLVGLGSLDGRDETLIVEGMAANHPNLADQVPRRRVCIPVRQAPALVALGEKMLSEVGTVLPCDSRNQRMPHWPSLRTSEITASTSMSHLAIFAPSIPLIALGRRYNIPG